MILRGHQNVESFLDAIAKHLSAPRAWQREIHKDENETIIFGSGYWKGDVEFDDDDGSVFGIQLVSDDYPDREVKGIEIAISLLEGMECEDEEPVEP